MLQNGTKYIKNYNETYFNTQYFIYDNMFF